MSRRPAVKVLLPLFLGIFVHSIRGSGMNTLQLFLVSVFLFLLALVLLKRSFFLLVDTILVLIFFITGLIMDLGESVRLGLPASAERFPVTALVEIVGFSDRFRNDWIRVEGCILYLADQKGFRSCRRRALIDLKRKSRIPYPGDLIVVNGEFVLSDRRKNPGGVSSEESFRQRGLIGSVRSRAGEWAYLGHSRNLLPWHSFWSELRGSSGALIDDVFPDDAGFLKGILLGAKGQISEERRDDFSRAGIYHVLAISGLHVGIISGVLFLIFSILRIPPFFRVLAATPVLLLYGFITGMRPAIQRAIVMMTSIMLAFSFQRKIDFVNLLYLIAMTLVVLSPSVIWSPGFQMSFLATWGILALYPGVNKLFKSLSFWRLSPFRRLFQIFLVSICAQLPLIPVIASSFHTLSLVSPFTNVAALPVVALLLPIGLLSLGAQMVSPILSVPFSEVTSLLIDLLYGASKFMSDIPFSSIRVSPFSTIGTITYYVVLFLASQLLEGRVKWEVIVIVLLFSGTVRIVIDVCSGEPPLRVTFLDIGQGDCAVIEFPSGGTMVMDGGPSRPGWSAGERVIDPFLLYRGIDRIDVVAFSHPQLDHIGGLLFLLERYEVDAIIEPGQPTYLNDYIRILGLSLKREVPVYLPRRGDSFRVGEVVVRFLHPTEEWLGDYPGQDEVNDASLVVKVAYGDVSFLLTGDIGPAVEEELVAEVGEELRANILKVAHHGSHVSTTIPFLDGVSPSIAVISVGRGNPFGHPAPSLIAMMKERGISVFRTDIQGAIVFDVEQNRFDLYDGSDDLLFSSEDTNGGIGVDRN